MPTFECISCSRRIETDSLEEKCRKCGSALLLIGPEMKGISRSEIDALPPGVWRFNAFLPEIAHEHMVTLGEGGTPLLPARRLGDELGFKNLLIKDETRNPTGSFIDRGSTVLVSLAKEKRVKCISCTTTGNLGASLAAYCAKAGIEVMIRVHPSTDHGKLYQMIAYGAQVEILSKVPRREQSEINAISVSAGNPFILEGEKTTGFEITHDMGWALPDAMVIPVGTGGHLTMIWRSLLQLHKAGLVDEPECKLIGVQLQASAPIVTGLQVRKRSGDGGKPFTELEESEPIFKNVAIESIKESKGCGIEVSPREAIQGMSLLARTEGIFAEPASASVIASLKTMKEERTIDLADRVVCVITGSGLKDTKSIRTLARTSKHVVTREALMIRPFPIGPTKVKIMKVLANGQSFGYEIWKALSKQRSITTASVYQHLSELEGIAFVRRSRIVTARGRERIFYELTRKGAEFLMRVKETGSEESFVVD